MIVLLYHNKIVLFYNTYKAIDNVIDTTNDKIQEATGVSSANTTKSEETKEITLGETISGKDVELNIESAQFSQNVEPPVKDMFYTHYQVSDSSNTYLYAILNCKKFII